MTVENEATSEPTERTLSNGVRVVETGQMPWRDPAAGRPFGNTGVKVKVLSHNKAGWIDTHLVWLPTWLAAISLDGTPERHFHKTVTERVLILSGEAPGLEYETLTGVGEKMLFKDGYFLDRLPGESSTHGFDPSSTRPRVYCTALEIRNGPRHTPGEDGETEENVSVGEAALASGDIPTYTPDGLGQTFAQPQDGQGIVHARKSVRIIDSRDLDWTSPERSDFSYSTHIKVRVLGRRSDGTANFQLVYMPPTGRVTLTEQRGYILNGSVGFGPNENTGEPAFGPETFFEVAEPVELRAGDTGCVYAQWDGEF